MKELNPMPRVSIILLNWNGLDDTLECLGTICRSDYPNYDIIVVDNCSTDDSIKTIFQKFPQVFLIKNSINLGYTGGNNIAMRYAVEHDTDYVWLLNNDTVVETDTLSKIVATAERDPAIGMVSPLVYFYGEPDVIQFCGSQIDWESASISPFSDPQSYEKNKNKPISLWGTALLIKRDVVEKIGYLDDKFFAYGEDEDYSIRVIRAGFRNEVQIYAKIHHKDSRSTGGRQSPLQVFLRLRNRYFIWSDKLRGVEKLNFMRRYLAFAISNIAEFKRMNLNEAVDAGLGGIWAALNNKGGPWERSLTMPAWFKAVFIPVCSWHPYLWCRLLNGEGSKIMAEVAKRLLKRKGMQINER